MIFYTTHAKGGSGASLFATNFAYTLTKQFPQKKILFIDANQLSDIATFFGINPQKNILNLSMFLEEELTENSSKKTTTDIFAKTTYSIGTLDVLLSPEKYHAQDTLNTLYKKTIKSALTVYDHIIIDGEKNNNALLQYATPNLQKLFVITTADNPSITKTKNFLNNLAKDEILSTKINIIYNQAEKFSNKDLENILPFPIAGTLPTEINGAWDNILLGVPIIENRKLAYTKKINQIIDNLIKN